MAESEESLRDKIVKWKSALEAKGLKMNTGKMKVMFSCNMKDNVEEKGKWPCGECKMRNASQSFICRCCKADSPITDGLNIDLHLDIGNEVSLEKADIFYL